MSSIKCFLNGRIYVSYIPKRIVEALVVANSRIIFTGTTKEAEEICRKLGGVCIDLKNSVVLPGFIDSHIHLYSLGLYLNALDLRGVRSIEELKRKLSEYSRRVETRWVLGHGWDQELFNERRWPTRWDIDEVVSDRPVILTRVCLHAAVLNTMAMRILGLFDSNIPGVLRDGRGLPTGIVIEEAFTTVFERLRESMALDEHKKLLVDAMRTLSSYGVTTVGFVSCSSESLRAMDELRREGRLLIRVRAYLNPYSMITDVRNIYGNRDVLEALRTIGIGSGFGDDRLRICGIKIIADGSLGARTAWLSKPYSDDPSTCGRPNIDEETLYTIAREADEIGLQLSIHGIGDRAIDMALNVYEKLGSARDRRHRIEHASLLRDDQMERMLKLGVVASVQPHFVITDWWAKDRVGVERVRWLYPFRSMAKKGIVIGIGTDSPVETPNPWETIYAAVARGRYEGIQYYNDTKDEALTLEEALHAYTYGSAYIMNEEHDLGTLEEGKLADFIVIDRDPFDADVRELRSIRVIETYIGGERIYP